MNEFYPPISRGNLLESVISTVGEVYARIERDQAGFLASAAASGAALVCPQGCGLCCEPFVPDITAAEAAFAASWLITQRPELAAEVAAWTPGDRPDAPPCPFYRRSMPEAHCAIYPARFLVCRLFCASAVRDKEGRAAFRPCAHMPLAAFPLRAKERPSLIGEELIRVFGAEPPVMADYSAEVVALFPSEASRTDLILDALPKAIARVGLSLSLVDASSDRAYSKRDECEG
jgi:Fe-S-cluster containining protein